MGRADPEQGVVVHRIKRAQPNGASEVLNRAIWALNVDVEVTAARPSPCRVRVDGKGLLNGRKPQVKLADQSIGCAEHGQDQRIGVVERGRILGQPNRFLLVLTWNRR